MSNLPGANNRYYLVLIPLGLFLLHFYYTSFSATSESRRDTTQFSKSTQRKQKVILITKWKESKDIYEWQNANKVCSNQCFFTTNATAWNESSAILFHGNNHEFLHKHFTRPSPQQIWIWLNLEPALAYQFYPEENKFLQFNWTLSYRRDSDIVAPYSRIFPIDNIPKQMQIIKEFEYNTTSQIESNGIPSFEGFSERKMAAWIVSHCSSWGKREYLVAQMQKHIPVDIYGSCGPKKCQNSRKKLKTTEECRLEIHQQYKFYLAFENSLCEDYVTEKFFDTLKFEMIPVVYGSVDYSSAFPPNSFINVFDYKSISELTEYMTYLSENPQEWLKYFEWKKHYIVVHSTYLPAYCDICDKLLLQEEDHPNGIPGQYYTDINHWWLHNHTSDHSICKNDEEVKEILSALQPDHE